MRRLLISLLILTCLLLPGGVALADTLTLPDSTTVIDDEAFYGDADIDRVVLPEGVVRIGVRAFAGTGLRAVSLPASVEQIDDSAFEACPELKVTAPKGSYAEAWALRMGYTLLPEPTPASDFVYEITDGECVITFYHGSDAQVRIPETIEGAPVTRIGNGAFNHMDFIKSITLNDGLKAINWTAFAYCSGLEAIEIPQSVTEIGEEAFCYDTSLKTVVLHEGLKTIGDSAFYGCASLERIEIPGSVTSLGISCLSSATSLKTVALHEGLQTIGIAAFNGCASLERLEIPDSVTSIGSRYIDDTAITYLAFGSGVQALTLYHVPSNATGDTPLETVVIPEGVLTIGEYIFEDLPRLKTVSLPESLTDIGPEAFKDCPELTEITIPAAVKAIGHHAFESCASLAEVTLNEGLESIGAGAFSGCTSLKRLVIPDSVTSFGGSFLRGDTALEYLSFGAGVKDLSRELIPDGSLAELVFRDGVETIDDWFCDTSTIVGKVTFPKTLRSIGKSAFRGSEFTELDIPASVTTIGEDAFRDCAGLETVTLHEGLQTIGSYAFLNCTSLKWLFLPDSVTEIGIGFVKGDTALEYLSFGGGFKALTTNHLPGNDVLKKVVFGQGIESIPNDMFKDKYPALSCVVLPDTLTKIGSCAFSNCESLTDLYLPDSLKTIGYSAFSGCDQLTEITIPGSVETIDNGAFYQCEGLRSVTLNEGLVSIGSEAFKECTALEALELPDSVTALGSTYSYSFISGDTALSYIAFGGGVKALKEWCRNLPALTRVVLNDGIETIDKYAFSGCAALAEIELPGTLNTIGASAFVGCTALPEVSLPESLQTLSSLAFSGCTALRKVSLPESLQTISSSAFLGCDALAEIDLPEGLLEIGSSAFKGCAALTDVAVPQSVTTINEDAFWDCAGLRSVTLREGLETIADGAFAGCTSLERMEIPDSVTSLGSYFIGGDTGLRYIAFGGGVERITKRHASGLANSSVEAVVFGEGVKIIDSSAFKGCASLGYVGLPESLNTIGGRAFDGCDIPSVYIPISVKSIGSNAFSCPEDRETIVIYGFAGSSAEDYAKGSERYTFYAVNQAPEQDEALQFSEEITVSPAEQTVYLGVGQKYTQPHWVFSGGLEFPATAHYVAEGDAVKNDIGLLSIHGARLGQANVACTVSLDGASVSRLKLDTSFTAVVVYDLPAGLELGIGQQLEVEAEIYDAVAGGQAGIDFTDVTWLCDDEDILSLTPVPGRAAVVVRALASGSADLKVRNAATGAETTTRISVLKPPSDLLFDEKSLELGVDETEAIHYAFKSGEYIDDVTFRSLDPTVARVSADGAVTAKKVGSTAIQVTAGDVTKEIPVTVGPKPAGMRFADSAVSLLPRCRMVMPEVLLTDADGNKAFGKLSFASDNENIVSVTGGKLYAKRSGTATITATTYVPGVEAKLTVEVIQSETWTRLLEAESRYSDVKNTLERKIKTANMRLANKASKFTSYQRSHYQSLLDSRITATPTNGKRGNLPTEVKRKLFDEVCAGMNKGTLDLSGINTPWALIYTLNQAIIGTGEDTRVFDYGGKKYTYHATTELGNSKVGMGVSMGVIDDGTGNEWTVVITSADNISGFMDQLKKLADDKVEDAIRETINSAGSMMGIGDISKYLKTLAREQGDTFMLYALNLSSNFADQAEDALMKLLGFKKTGKTLNDIADNTEFLSTTYGALEKLFGLQHVDLQHGSEMFSLKKLVDNSTESLNSFETALDFYMDIF